MLPPSALIVGPPTDIEIRARGKLREEGAFDELNEALADFIQTKESAGITVCVADLDVSQNHLSSEQIGALLTTLSNRQVKRMRFFGTPTFDDLAAQHLADFFRSTSKDTAPNELHLSDCAITTDGFFVLMSAIEDTGAYPRTMLRGLRCRLYLRLEKNYIDKAALQEKVDTEIIHMFRKGAGGMAPQTAQIDLLLSRIGEFDQNEGTPPDPEDAPPPKFVQEFGKAGRGPIRPPTQPPTPRPGFPVQQPCMVFPRPMGMKGMPFGGCMLPQAMQFPLAQALAASMPGKGLWPGCPVPAARPSSPPPGHARPMHGSVASGAARPRPFGAFGAPASAPAAERRPARPTAQRPAGVVKGADRAADRSRTPPPLQKKKGGTARWVNPKKENENCEEAAPNSVPQINLPHPWEEHWSEEYGIPYFWHPETNESLWEPPVA